MEGADSFIMFHNHPSSVTEPSHEDDDVTARVSNASKLIGIEMLDHVIVGGFSGDYYSYAEEKGSLYGLKKWSDEAAVTDDEKLIDHFMASKYGSVKINLLLNPNFTFDKIEKLAGDENGYVSSCAKRALEDAKKKCLEVYPGVRKEIEALAPECKAAEGGRLYSYGKALKKG